MRTTPLLALLPLLALSASPAAAGEERPFDEGPRMERLIERYATDSEAISSFYRVPLSARSRARRDALAAQWLEQLGKVDFDGLGQSGKVDYVLLRNHIERQRGRIAFEAERAAATATLLPFAADIVALEEGRRGLTAMEPRAAADTLESIHKAVDAVRKRVQKGQKDAAADGALAAGKVVAFRAAGELKSLEGALKAWFEYRDGYEPEFGWWTRKPHEALRKALEGYEKYLRETVAGAKGGGAAPLIGDPIGEAALLRELGHEMIPYTPDQLLAVAREQFAWCEAEGKKAAAELGFEGDWKKTVEHVKGLHADPGEQDELVTAQARGAIAFVEERDLVTVPDLCKELWRLDMISEDGQKTLPFAAYSDHRMLVAYPTEGMQHETKLMSLRGNNEHFTRIVTPHELIPGHHLQLFMARRHNPHRNLFRTPFLVEGWALHWEMLLWDEDYPRGPEDRVGMLFWRMHRCARIIVTLEFHLGRMQPDEMVSFLTGRVGLEKDGATSEVRRYIAGDYGPLYQCAYMLGGLQIRALREELVGSGRMSDRVFHDALLRENSIPVEMIRASLVGTALTRDFETVWRFAGDR